MIGCDWNFILFYFFCRREAGDTSLNIKKTIKKEHKHHVSEMHKARQLTHKVHKEQHIREEVREALSEAKQAVAEAGADDYLLRRRLQVEEAEVRLALTRTLCLNGRTVVVLFITHVYVLLLSLMLLNILLCWLVGEGGARGRREQACY